MARQVSMQFGKPTSGVRRSGTTKGMTIDLLWENPSPSSNFGAQTIELDLSQYDAIWLIAAPGTTNLTSNLGTTLIPKDGNRYTAITQNVTTGTRYTYNRGVTADDDGVTFTTGYRGATTGTNYFIPLSIYGIRFRGRAVVSQPSDIETYTGSYSVEPNFQTQTLATANKRMSSNVTVNEIEVSTTTNPEGGNTIYIGGTSNG